MAAVVTRRQPRDKPPFRGPREVPVHVFVRPIRWLYITPLFKGAELLAIAGTGYGLIGLLVIILLIVLIVYFVRRA